MSARHRTDDVIAMSREERRAHGRAERQRVRAELRFGEALDEEVDAPGVEWRQPHHRWHAKRHGPDDRVWKRPFWKRRTNERRAKAWRAIHIDS